MEILVIKEKIFEGHTAKIVKQNLSLNLFGF